MRSRIDNTKDNLIHSWHSLRKFKRFRAGLIIWFMPVIFTVIEMFLPEGRIDNWVDTNYNYVIVSLLIFGLFILLPDFKYKYIIVGLTFGTIITYQMSFNSMGELTTPIYLLFTMNSILFSALFAGIQHFFGNHDFVANDKIINIQEIANAEELTDEEKLNKIEKIYDTF